MSEASPVLFIIFRRPETTLPVFQAIRAAKPPKLYISADGPRPGRPGEAELCAQTRAIVQNVDWPCEVKTRFHESNQGIQKGVAGAISWFFSQEEQGIILEDDCLPHPDFFPYCAKLLDRYRSDERVMHIGGVNFQPVASTDAGGYYFSRYNHVWGWATWRRAWDRYRGEFEGLDRFLIEAGRTGFWDSAREQKYWTRTFAQTRRGEIVTWDYQWKFTLWAEGGLGITPDANLIVNLGFGDGATNTGNSSGNSGARGLEPLGPVGQNPWVFRHRVADQHTFSKRYWGTSWARWQHRWYRLRSALLARKKL
jgi:hypothetical protein